MIINSSILIYYEVYNTNIFYCNIVILLCIIINILILEIYYNVWSTTNRIETYRIWMMQYDRYEKKILDIHKKREHCK